MFCHIYLVGEVLVKHFAILELHNVYKPVLIPFYQALLCKGNTFSDESSRCNTLFIFSLLANLGFIYLSRHQNNHHSTP